MSQKLLARATLALSLMVGAAPLASVWFAPAAYAQNATTGALTGVVTDSTGAVVPGAQITITDTATGATTKLTSNAAGRYTAPLLKPSRYKVTATANGLSSSPTDVNVLLGQTPNLDLTVTPNAGSTTITVSAQAAQLTDTQSPALITTFTEKQVQELPAPGGDITTVAFTAPGVVLNSGGSYGNFSADGLPGTSNLYVLNGFDDEDPFLNLNNSGSSNLTLGQGEISEASVVENGYSAQYGRAAGVIINYTTKSGTNAFHGMANYYYNGDVLNANDWFRNYYGQARPRAISNEWATNIGGPIVKDKLFFFVDYEGLHYVLPYSADATFPTSTFQAAVISRIPAEDVPLYQQAFALYNSSPSLKSATPVNNTTDSTGTLGCGSAAALAIPDGSGGTFGTTSPCSLFAIGSSSNVNKEWLLTGRVDWNISNKQRLFGRYKMDRGSQPTYTNFISPAFNTVSSQPAYEGQLNDTYTFNPNLTNQFVFAANWYTAYFGPANLSSTLSTFPTYLLFQDGGAGSSSGVGTLGMPNAFPQGRNVTQYQLVDDLSWIKGNHTFRFGYNFRRDDVSDFDAQENEAGYYYLLMSDFANGTLSPSSVYSQNFANSGTNYLALYNLGTYAQDEWQAASRLKLTLGIRFDRTGNPLCNNNCFSSYNGGFPYAGVTTATAYNTLIRPGLAHPFDKVQAINVQPRIGFNYDVEGNGHTVVRGGFGLFTDLYPAGFLDNFINNFPNVYTANVASGDIAPAASAGSAPSIAAASNAALRAGFAGGGSSSTIGATVTGFAPPSFAIAPSEFKNPTYAEWNLQIQRQISRTDAVILSYVGNSGYDEIMTNPWVNANYSANGAPFAELPATAPDPNFGTVTEFYNPAHSNYNGTSVTYKHIDGKGVTVDVTYTYSKALDDTSNGGTGEYYNPSSTTTQLDPLSPSRLNYSYADYDFRHAVSADYVWDMPYHFHNFAENEALGGWSIAGKTFWRTGQPFTVYNSAAPNTLNAVFTTGYNGVNEILADVTNPVVAGTQCGHAAANPNTPCLSTADFVSSGQANFGNYPRNSFFGPHYSDTDLSLFKRFINTKRVNLQLGATAYNVFNHPNFALPNSDVTQSGFGSISSIAAPPTSPYGSFQGAGVGGRVVQVFGKFNF